MAVSQRNPNGAVGIFDGGTPRTFTIKARENISGGYWVNGSSALGAVGSDSSSYTSSDIEGYTVSTVIGSLVIGLAITDIASGTYGTVASRGTFLMPAGSGFIGSLVLAGQGLWPGSAGIVYAAGSSTAMDPTKFVYPTKATALTSADGGLGQFCVVSVNI
jgi:hypothetical protein